MKRHCCTSALVVATQTVLNQPMILSGPQQASKRTKLSQLALERCSAPRTALFFAINSESGHSTLWDKTAALVEPPAFVFCGHDTGSLNRCQACHGGAFGLPTVSHYVHTPPVMWQRAQLCLDCRLGAMHVREAMDANTRPCLPGQVLQRGPATVQSVLPRSLSGPLHTAC